MLRVTLDHNCIIAMENGSGQREALVTLVGLHNEGRVQVFVGMISASENAQEGKESSVPAFEERLERLGLQAFPRLPPEARIDMSYIDHSVIAEDDGLAERVRAIVRPEFPAGSDDERFIRKLRNLFCDVDGLVAHTRAGNDLFVTEDGHFTKEKRREALRALGVGDVVSPQEAVNRILTEGDSR